MKPRDPLLRLLALARPSAPRFLAGVLLGAVAAGSGIALLGLAGWLLARAAEHPPITALSVAVVATRALGVTRGVARYLERLLSHDAALRALAAVRAQVYERLARTEPVRRFRSADLVSRLVNDVDSTQDLLVRGLSPPLVAGVAGGTAAAVCAVLLTPGGALLALGLLLGGVAVPLAAARLGRAAGRRQAAARAALSTAVTDTLHGAGDLLAYGAMQQALERVRGADAELTRIARRDAHVLALSSGAHVLVMGLTVWSVLLLGVAAVEEGALSAITLAVVVLTALAAFEVVAPLSAVAAKLGAVRQSGARLCEALDAEPAVRGGAAMRSGPPPGGELRIEGLRVRYGPEEPWVLDGVDLVVPAGRRAALTGPSGCGKSTLAEVLFRFRDPDHGSVHLGGVDMAACSVEDWRTVVSGLPQDAHLFDSTVRENLRLARPGAEEAELWGVLERVRLADDVQALPRGLDTEVGVHGGTLSGGMRTRLALARALLTDARLLILDEPTAHLDPDTAREVFADLLHATEGRTVLLITHDPEHLEYMDAVCTLAASGAAATGEEAPVATPARESV